MNIRSKLFYPELPEFGNDELNIAFRNLATIPKTNINDLVSVDIITNGDTVHSKKKYRISHYFIDFRYHIF